jgi:Uncharacterised nucleotidyltransferase
MNAIVACRDPRVGRRVAADLDALRLSYRVVQMPTTDVSVDHQTAVYFLDAAAANTLTRFPKSTIVVVANDVVTVEMAKRFDSQHILTLRLEDITPESLLSASILATTGWDSDELARRVLHLGRFHQVDPHVIAAFLRRPAGMTRLTDLRRALKPLSREMAQRLVRSCGFYRAEHLFTALRCATWALLMEGGVERREVERHLGIADRASFRRACRRASVPTLHRGLRLALFEIDPQPPWSVMADVAANLSDCEITAVQSDDLLAAFVSPRPPATVVPRLAALTDAEWDTLVRRAHRHDLVPLLRHQLHTIAPGVVPRRVIRTCDVVYADVARRNACLYDALALVLRALSAERIPCVVLKGAYLADAVYPDRALRRMDDIDLLVPRPSMKAAQSVILSLGYRRSPHGLCLHDLLDCHLQPFEKDDVEIELHWSTEGRAAPDGKRGGIRRPHPIDIDEVWTRVETTQVGGATALTLASEDFLLHLALHTAFHHGFHIPLQKVCDIAWMAHRRAIEISWARLAKAAEASRASRLVYVVLRLIREIHGPYIPSDAIVLPDWSEHDEHVFRAIRLLVLRYPRVGSREWQTLRVIIDPWWRAITGIRGRGPARLLV